MSIRHTGFYVPTVLGPVIVNFTTKALNVSGLSFTVGRTEEIFFTTSAIQIASPQFNIDVTTTFIPSAGFLYF